MPKTQDKIQSSVKEKRLARDRKRKQYDCLFVGDNYIKGLIIRGSTLTHKDIPQELIEMKRDQLKTYRPLKDIKKTMKEM